MTLRHDRAWPRHEVLEGVPVMRVAGRVAGGRERFPGPLRKLAYLLGLLAMGWTLWWHHRQYEVLCVYQINLLVVPVAMACVLSGKPLVILLRSADSRRGASLGPEARVPDALRRHWAAHNRDVGDLEALESLGAPVLRGTGYLLRHTQAVLVVLSARMMHELAARGLQLPVTLCIPNGVDLARFVPVCTDPLEDERARTVVCVARLTYQKGVDVLLHAWQLVHAQIPAARLIIVGTGPLHGELERLAKTLGLESTVDFAGLQSDVPAQLQRGDLAVLPSRWEGMPNAVLEAMACGLPCVATRVSGSEDLIQHGVNGLLVEPDDHRGLARALLTLLRDRALAQHYGRAARATIEQHYALDRITDRYVVLYETLARGGPLDRLIDHVIGAAGRR
jgi:glycosyltransferase involved in cell wall biosynthesis